MSSDQNEEKIEFDRKEKSEVSAIVGLLDFYSDRAEAQASFLVACVFGLFTLLAIVQNVKNIVWISAGQMNYYEVFQPAEIKSRRFCHS